MKCDSCDGDTKVTNSRDAEGNVVRRRRECLVCETRTTTYEISGELYRAMIDTWNGIDLLKAAQASIGDAMILTRSARDAMLDVVDSGGGIGSSPIAMARVRRMFGAPSVMLARPDE